MAAQYHINPETGDVNECKAKLSECKFGPHFDTPDDAREDYEYFMASERFITFQKSGSPVGEWLYGDDEWLNTPFEERKKIIEKETQKIAKANKIIPPPPKVEIIWMRDQLMSKANARAETSGQGRKSIKRIRYNYWIEEFGKTTCKTIMCHELAHLKVENEGGHDENWEKHFVIISQCVKDVKIEKFERMTKLSGDERVRLIIRKARDPENEFFGLCVEQNHVFFAVDTKGKMDLCSKCNKIFEKDVKINWQLYNPRKNYLRAANYLMEEIFKPWKS